MTAPSYRKLLLLGLIFLSFTFYVPVLMSDQDILTIGRFIGLIGLQLIWWQIVLGNRWLTRPLAQDWLWVNRVHRFTGTYGFLFILIHPLIMISTYGLTLVWPLSFASTFDIGVRAGMTGITLLAFIWFTSAILRGRVLSWRGWKRLHYLAYVVFLFLYLHQLLVGASTKQFWWLQVWVYTLVAVFWLVVFLRLLNWAGITKERYEVMGTQKVARDVTRFRLRPKGRGIRPLPGQFAYFQGRRYGESHPFTVSHYDEESGEIGFSIKAVGPYSRRLTSLSHGDEVYIDGPYGVFTSEIGQKDRPVVVIAGGIGITPFIRHLEAKNIDYLFWGCRSEADIAYRGTVEASGAKAYYVFSEQPVSSTKHKTGQIDGDLLKTTLDQPLSAYDFYLCGPPPMMKSLHKQLTANGVQPANIYQEKFSL